MKFTIFAILASTSSGIKIQHKVQNTLAGSSLAYSDWPEVSEDADCDYDWFPWAAVLDTADSYLTETVDHYADCIHLCNHDAIC